MRTVVRMELRLISSDEDRAQIARVRSAMSGHNRHEVTAHLGASTLAIHEQYGRSYALFESIDRAPVGGFSIHSLDMYAQAHSEPALTGLAPSKVVEISELWSVTRHKIPSLLNGMFILCGLNQLDGLLVYPTIKPKNWTIEFLQFHRATEPLILSQNDDVWVQGMLLRDADLRLAVQRAMEPGFDVRSGLVSITFGDVKSEIRDLRSG